MLLQNNMVSLKEFSLVFYQQTEAKEALLILQNSFSCNVLIMLWCMWIEKCGFHLTQEQQHESELLFDSYSERWLIKIRKQRFNLSEQDYLAASKTIIEKHLLMAEVECELAILELMDGYTQKNFEESFSLNKAEILSHKALGRSQNHILHSYLNRHFEVLCHAQESTDWEAANKMTYQRIGLNLSKLSNSYNSI